MVAIVAFSEMVITMCIVSEMVIAVCVVSTVVITVCAVSYMTSVIKMVAHTTISMVGNGAVVVTVSVVVTQPSVNMPAVPSIVGDVECRTSEIEESALRIASIDAEMPVASIPV